MEKKVYVDGMMCKHCAARVEKALAAVEGVSAAKVDLEDKSCTVSLTAAVADEVLTGAVSAAGYTPVSVQ